MAGDASDTGKPLSAAVLAVLFGATIATVAALLGLGKWQLERRAWKLDLIARIEQRVHAPPVAAPGPAEWPQVGAARDEYRRVKLSGVFLHESETRVQASTVLGVGHWVLTPLRCADGSVVLVNRGFVASESRAQAPRSSVNPLGTVTVIGLLRISEPGGFFLRRNNPAADRWHSRDVQAIAARRGLSGVAPYFVDAVASTRRADGGPLAGPVGGLTVIDFPNNHLVYALTWFALALMVAAAAAWVFREESRRRRARSEAALPVARRLPGDVKGF